MLLLPVLYLAVVAAAAGFVAWHAVNGLSLLKGFPSLWRFFLYAGPLVVGVILMFFLIKPLFARSPKAGRLRFVELGTEPVLFAFVGRIARAVRAPEPRRIAVDWEVNASASFGDGLAVLFGHDLVLTIGLPLVAGLTVQQLAGVLAHELGHFAQGGGMRLSFVIRSINTWFARVVYERDAWDEHLVEWCEDSGRLALIFYLARVCVFLTRGLLWVFMICSHGISCFLLGQMERDADRYEVRLAGSETFANTSRRLTTLDVAAQGALASLGHAWVQERYPEDFASLIVAQADEMPRPVRRQLDKLLRQSATGLFDTHPSFAERVRLARRENAPGIFRLNRPATLLFRNFAELSRAVSLDLYRQLFGRHVKRSNLFPLGVSTADPKRPGPDTPED
jgi:Zn-dependent protease with chaperone function